MSIGQAARSDESTVRKGGTFRMVPDALFAHPDLEPQDIKTWCFLCLHARSRDRCTPTDRSLAEDMGVVERTVKRSLTRLEKTGFIRRERRGPERTIYLTPEGRADAPSPFTLKLLSA